jgi:triacylglycerol lipase
MAGFLDSSLAVINGVLGDYLARTENGLATETELHSSTAGGRPLVLEPEALRRSLPNAGPRIALLVHGLMCTESIWQMPDGSDYGTRLASDLGMVPLYARYNTGLPLTESGASLSRMLTRLVAAYPVPIGDIVAIGHSMGGLVVRSASHAAELDGSSWLRLVRRAIYLGTPHLGSPFERIGRVVTRVLQTIPDPYTRMIADIAELRSRGIKDLGDGLRDASDPIPLLPQIQHYLLAGSLSDDPWLATLFGDSLVPVGSATNGVVDARRGVLPPDHVKVLHGHGHIGLAHDPDVYEHLRGWCQGDP